MQFLLEIEELNLLADLLFERLSPTSDQASSPGRIQPDSDTEHQDARRCNELLDRVLARDLRFDSDELEFLEGLVLGKKRSLKDEIAQQPNATLKLELQRKMAFLEDYRRRSTRRVPWSEAVPGLLRYVAVNYGVVRKAIWVERNTGMYGGPIEVLSLVADTSLRSRVSHENPGGN